MLRSLLRVLGFSLRLLLLLVSLYAVSNALKELLLQEDELQDTITLILLNVLIATVCWSAGCWAPRAKKGKQPAAMA